MEAIVEMNEESNVQATDETESEIIIHDADAEDRAARAVETDETTDDEIAPSGPRSMAELMSTIEALVFVSEEPLPAKTIAEVLDEERGYVEMALEELAKEFNERNSGLLLREVAGGWQIETRSEEHTSELQSRQYL